MIEMNRFKKTIASAVPTLLMAAFAIFPIGEAEAKVKARFDKSYIPPGNMAKAGRSAKIASPKVGTGKTLNPKDGSFRGARNSRRSFILPYLEQDNLYR
jgi:hypothetical protein